MSKVRKSLAEAESEKAAALQKCEELRAYIERTVPAVEEMYGERVHDPKKRSVAQLKKEKQTLESKQQREQARQGGKTLEQLAALATKAAELATKSRQDMETVKKTGQIHEEAFIERAK